MRICTTAAANAQDNVENDHAMIFRCGRQFYRLMTTFFQIMSTKNNNIGQFLTKSFNRWILRHRCISYGTFTSAELAIHSLRNSSITKSNNLNTKQEEANNNTKSSR